MRNPNRDHCQGIATLTMDSSLGSNHSPRDGSPDPSMSLSASSRWYHLPSRWFWENSSSICSSTAPKLLGSMRQISPNASAAKTSGAAFSRSASSEGGGLRGMLRAIRAGLPAVDSSSPGSTAGSQQQRRRVDQEEVRLCTLSWAGKCC